MAARLRTTRRMTMICFGTGLVFWAAVALKVFF